MAAATRKPKHTISIKKLIEGIKSLSLSQEEVAHAGSVILKALNDERPFNELEKSLLSALLIYAENVPTLYREYHQQLFQLNQAEAELRKKALKPSVRIKQALDLLELGDKHLKPRAKKQMLYLWKALSKQAPDATSADGKSTLYYWHDNRKFQLVWETDRQRRVEILRVIATVLGEKSWTGVRQHLLRMGVHDLPAHPNSGTAHARSQKSR